MATLTPQQTTAFRSLLRQRAAVLRGEIQSTVERSSEESHVRIAERARDVEDDSFSNLIVDVNLAEIDRDAMELRDIDSALQRLAAGTYGVCVACGRDIPLARLEVEPTATRCVECQEQYEKTHASPGTPSL